MYQESINPFNSLGELVNFWLKLHKELKPEKQFPDKYFSERLFDVVYPEKKLLREKRQ